MKVTSSYAVHVQDHRQSLKATVSLYRAAVAFIKVNGKTSGFEPGDESEHLIPPYTQNCVFVICTWSTVVI